MRKENWLDLVTPVGKNNDQRLLSLFSRDGAEKVALFFPLASSGPVGI